MQESGSVYGTSPLGGRSVSKKEKFSDGADLLTHAEEELKMDPEENNQAEVFTRLNKVKHFFGGVKDHFVRNRSRYLLGGGVVAGATGAAALATGIGLTATGVGAPLGIVMIVLSAGLFATGPFLMKLAMKGGVSGITQKLEHRTLTQKVNDTFKADQYEISSKDKKNIIKNMWSVIAHDPFEKNDLKEKILLRGRIDATKSILLNTQEKKEFKSMIDEGYNVNSIRDKFEARVKKNSKKLKKTKEDIQNIPKTSKKSYSGMSELTEKLMPLMDNDELPPEQRLALGKIILMAHGKEINESETQELVNHIQEIHKELDGIAIRHMLMECRLRALSEEG